MKNEKNMGPGRLSENIQRDKNKQKQVNSQSQEEEDNQDLTAFEKFEKELKLSIFNVLYVLLKDDETKAWKIVLMGFCDFFQIFQFTFLPAVQFPWNGDEVSHYYNTYLDFFQIAVWLGRLDLSSYIVVIYIGIFIIILIILDILYVSYSFSRKKFTYVWPLQALRSTVGLFVTVLFLPFLEMFTSMLYCIELEGSDDGKQYLYLFPQLECWKGAHIIHAAFCIAVSIVFIVICITVSLTYFDNDITSISPDAKVNQRADCFNIILKIILNYAYTFFGTSEYHWLLLIILLILSSQAYRNFRVMWPYYDDRINKFFCCLTGTFLWGNIVLLLIKIIEGTNFNGGFQLYFLGLPLVLAIIIFEPDERKKLLLKNINNFEKDQYVALQIRYFLRLIQNKDTDRGNNVIIKGYIYHHEDFCPNPDCLLKRYKSDFDQSIQEWKLDKKRDMTKFQENLHDVLIQHARSMYRSAIARFPDSPTLKIQYALFLIELMDNKNDALIQLKLASMQSPDFDEQFVIFRFTKHIEDNQDDHQGDGGTGSTGMDLIAKLAFESTLKQLSEEINKSARYHYEFWNQLRNERPDISKLNELGNKINKSVKLIDEQWQYLQKVNSNSPRALRLYSKFLMHILNDKERGMDYLMRAKEAKQNFFEGHSDDMLDYDSLSQNGQPFGIIDGGENAKLGQITEASTGLAKLFGFDRNELINHHIDKMMPEIYAKNHQKVLEKISGADPETVNGKERFIFGKHKSGYVFPCLIQIKAIRNTKSGYQYIAMFKIDKKQFSSFLGYVLVGRDKKISGLSSSCISLIDMDLKKLQKLNTLNVDLQRIAPEVFDMELNNLRSIEWRLPDLKKAKLEDSKKKSLMAFDSKSFNKISSSEKLGSKSHFASKYGRRQSLQRRDSNIPYYSKFLVSSLSQITMGEFGEIGWYVKIVQQDEQNRLHQDKVRVKNENKKVLGVPLFQFNYNANDGKYVRELVSSVDEDKNKNMNAIMRLIDQEHKNMDESRSQSPTKRGDMNEEDQLVRDEEVKLEFNSGKEILNTGGSYQRNDYTYNAYGNVNMLVQKRKWGTGINIYKLVSGKFYPKDYDEDLKKQQEAEDARKRQIEEEEKLNLIEEMGVVDVQSAQKTRKALQIAFNDKSTPRAISNLKLGTNLVMISFLILAITEFAFNNSQFEDINSNFNLIRMSYGRISEIQRIAYDIRTLININEKKQQVYQNYSTAPDFVEYLKLDIEDALNQLWQLHGNITLNSLQQSDKQNRLMKQKTVPLYYRENKNKTAKKLQYSLTEAVLQVASAVFSVRHMNLTQFYDGQEDLFFIIYNSYNDFLLSLQKSSLYYMEDLQNRAETKFTLIILVFIISVCVVFGTVVILLPMIFNVNRVRIKVLTLFIDIPQSNVEELADRCESFIYKEDEEQPDEEYETVDKQQLQEQEKEAANGGDPQLLKKKRQMSKIPKNAARSYTSLYLRFGVAAAAILGYFIGMFIVSVNYLNTINRETIQLNVQSQNEYELAFAQNVQRELIYNSSMPILNADSFKVALDSLETISQLTQRIRSEQLQAVDGDFQNEFKYLYMNNLCTQTHIKFELIPFKCSEMLNNAPINGYQLVVTKYFETLKENFKQFILEKENTQNSTLLQQKMFNSDRFLNLYIMQYRFIQDSNRHLISLLQQSESYDYDVKIGIRLALFICFVICLLSGYVIIWLPYVSGLNNQIWRTRAMLTIIPLDVIVQMPKIREFLNKQNFFSRKTKKS